MTREEHNGYLLESLWQLGETIMSDFSPYNFTSADYCRRPSVS
jgi:hypothetical protein